MMNESNSIFVTAVEEGKEWRGGLVCEKMVEKDDNSLISFTFICQINLFSFLCTAHHSIVLQWHF